MHRLLALALAAAALAAACAPSRAPDADDGARDTLAATPPAASDTSAAPAPADSPLAPPAGRAITPASFFDPAAIEPGDTVLGLRVASKRVAPYESGWVGMVEFEGEVALSGRYAPHGDYPEFVELCFFPDSASAARLPRFAADQRISWFCFQNQPQARRLLADSPATGAADVVVRAFRYVFEPTDVYNQATLVRATRKTPAPPAP
jgi:hypothetical protein